MDLEKILKEITSGLTGDNTKDMQYLKEQSEKYKEHEYAKEILRACGRLMYELIPSDKKKELENGFYHKTDHYRIIYEAKEKGYQLCGKWVPACLQSEGRKSGIWEGTDRSAL